MRYSKNEITSIDLYYKSEVIPPMKSEITQINSGQKTYE